jgi:hypothetical protein
MFAATKNSMLYVVYDIFLGATFANPGTVVQSNLVCGPIPAVDLGYT